VGRFAAIFAGIVPLLPGEIWCDNAFYPDSGTGQDRRKYIIVLSEMSPSQDAIVAVFTTKPNGMTDIPPCSLGHPREGYYVGIPGGILLKESWIPFDSLRCLEDWEISKMIRSGRFAFQTMVIPTLLLCRALRCLLQSENISNAQARQIANTAAGLSCP
jgi:hypothetical protein